MEKGRKIPMDKKKKIGILGSIAMDNIFNARSVPEKGERVFGNLIGSCIGGMAANQAVEAARYSDQIYLLGSVGTDETGDRIYRHLEERGCRTELLIRNTAAVTGQTYMFLVEDNNDYFSVVSLGANKTLRAEDVIPQLKDIDVLLISLEINIQTAQQILDHAEKSGIYTYLCLSPAENCTQEMIEKADALIANRREAEMLLHISGETAEEILHGLAGCPLGEKKLILISLGEKGAVFRLGGRSGHVKGIKVNPVDPVGAGDAFAGAFVAARESGEDIYRALCYGCIAGGFTVSVVGAQSSEHTAADVEEIYRKQYL